QRDAADTSLKPSQPKAVQQAKENPVALVETPSEENIEPVALNTTEGFSEDIDAEIEAAIGNVSMESLMGGASEEESSLEFNSRVKASVTKIHGDNVFVSLKGRFEGIVSLSQFKSEPSEGQLIEVVVKNRNEEDGLYEVSIPGSTVAVGDWDDINVGDIVEARISGSNTGGLEAMINNLRAFIPASQIDRFRVEKFGEYVNQKLECIVTEVNPAKKKLVLSRRAILDREFEEKRKELLASITVGDAYDGTVTKIMDFGAFVDIGGVEGLVHVSKLSWDRVTNPKDVVTEGEKVKVKIEKINEETGKLSLSIRDTIEHPWDGIESRHAANEMVKGTVTKLSEFGAFVKLEPGVEGLVHISEIAHHRVVKVSNHVNRGDEVEVKILSIDTQKQKMSLSIKATQTAPVTPEKQKKEEVDEPIRELAVPQSDQPLKGGTDRKTGGEEIGLNW
ncbi:MAG: S1 RNA-binding domain-containing protein, partial [Planctomycetota bacterium]